VVLPAIKSSLLMPWVVATRPPTSTLEPGAKKTPLGLVRNTWPGAVILPKIWLPPRTDGSYSRSYRTGKHIRIGPIIAEMENFHKLHRVPGTNAVILMSNIYDVMA